MPKTIWTMDDFDNAVKESRIKNSSLSVGDDDILTRQARHMEARNYFEGNSFIEFIEHKFSFHNRIHEVEKFTFFWETSSVFSQWYKCNFDLSFINSCEPIIKEDNDIHHFSSAEQYMMFAKAMLFLDRDSAKEILYLSDPRQIKEIGRKIKYFNETIWDYQKIDIVYNANKAKFTSDPKLLEQLIATKGTTLVEASPYDTIWGIGLIKEDQRSRNRGTWQGLNLLGEILTQLRVDITGEY